MSSNSCVAALHTSMGSRGAGTLPPLVPPEGEQGPSAAGGLGTLDCATTSAECVEGQSMKRNRRGGLSIHIRKADWLLPGA